MSNPTRIYTITPKDGETRMCLDPWAKVFIRANGDVHLCCYNTNVGNLSEGTLDEVLNNETAQAYRQGLLTGNLKPACQCCGDKQACTTIDLMKKVQEWLDKGTMDVL